MQNVKKFECVICNYTCNKQSDLKKHMLTRKHNNMIKSNIYECNCGKKYLHRQSLNKHKKKCCVLEDKINEIIETNKKLLKENEEIRSKLENHATTINNSFNLHLYLNENCKDAINLQEFISGIDISYCDLQTVRDEGLEYSVTKLLIQSLRELDNNCRPIQCTDVKREVVYVKDENVWQKDDENTKIKSSIMQIQDKHVKSINQLNINNKYDDSYIDLISKVTSDLKVNAVTKNLLKESKVVK